MAEPQTLLNGVSVPGPGTALSTVGVNKAMIRLDGPFDAMVLFEYTMGDGVWKPIHGTLLGTEHDVDIVGAPRSIYFNVEPVAAIRPNVLSYKTGAVTATGYVEPGGKTVQIDGASWQEFSAVSAGAQLKAVAGVLRKVTVNDPGSSVVISLYDAVGAQTTPIAVIKAVAGTLEYDLAFANGLYAVIAATTMGNVTITWN